jgi:hypothetical protein
LAELLDVAEGLGLAAQTVSDMGGFAASRAYLAMDGHGNPGYVDPEATTDAGPELEADVSDERFVRRVQYVADHGLRALGQVAIFDQAAAIDLAESLMPFLRNAGDPSWPLVCAYATLPWRHEDWAYLAELLDDAPVGAPRELARCLLPPELQARSLSGGPDDRVDEFRRSSWSRRGLALYGIDLEVLRTVVLGHDPADSELVVSGISTPTVLRALVRSIEAALREARVDRYHWEAGLSVIQPTDPEVMLAIRACTRSTGAGSWMRDLPTDVPMVRALVRLADALEEAE